MVESFLELDKNMHIWEGGVWLRVLSENVPGVLAGCSMDFRCARRAVLELLRNAAPADVPHCSTG